MVVICNKAVKFFMYKDAQGVDDKITDVLNGRAFNFPYISVTDIFVHYTQQMMTEIIFILNTIICRFVDEMINNI